MAAAVGRRRDPDRRRSSATWSSATSCAARSTARCAHRRPPIQQGDTCALERACPRIPASAGGPAPYCQVRRRRRHTQVVQRRPRLPIDADAMAIASRRHGRTSTDVVRRRQPSARAHVRRPRLDRAPASRWRVQLARPLNGVDHVLSNLRLILLLVLRRRDRARRARSVASPPPRARAARRGRADRPSTSARPTTSSSRIHVHADDEVGQLAHALQRDARRLQGSRAALDESVRAQRQLVADASHELRTPVTSLRTNIEVLLAERRARRGGPPRGCSPTSSSRARS